MIRNGEKLHEEMISSEESAFTDYSQENYLIGSDRVNDKLKSYDSEGSLMSSSEVLPFLRENGVV